MIKLIDILNEYNVNKPVKYKYRVGQTVRELNGDEEACQILDRRPNWTAVEANPINKEWTIFTFISDENKDEPWYLVQWLEDNEDKEPSWWNESELQPYIKTDK